VTIRTTTDARNAVVTRTRFTWPALVAGALVVLVGFDQPVYRTLSAASVAGAALAPVWWSALRHFRGARTILGLGVLALFMGLALTEASSADHRTSNSLALTTTFILINVLIGSGLLLWARTLMRTSAVAVLVGVGMLGAVLSSGLGLSAYTWRFGYSVPVAVLALALAWHAGRRKLQAVLALALAAGSALAGGRSTFAMLLVAAIVTAWQATTARTRSGSRAKVVALSLALVFAIYQVGQGLILDGYLGESAQARTTAQIAASGNILLGARPEMGATIALFAHQPLGFGSGTLSTLADIRVAKEGMAQLGYDPNNGYVDRYMFGSGYELHSIIGDTWARFGLAGLAFCLAAIWFTTQSVAGLVARRAAPALVTFLAVRLVWNALFGPVLSTSTLTAATIGLLLAVRSGDRHDVTLDIDQSTSPGRSSPVLGGSTPR